MLPSDAVTLSDGITLSPVRVHRWSWTTEQQSPMSFYLPNNKDVKIVSEGQRGEAFVKRVASLACSECTRDDVILDVGANEGFYAMLGAAHGCGVFAFDLQEGCAAPFESARAHNARVLDRIAFDATRVRFVSRPLGLGAPLMLPAAPGVCGPMVRFKAGHAANNQTSTRRVVPLGGSALTSLIASYRPASVALVKVDVEGAELTVLDTLQPLLSAIQHLVVEVTPELWPGFGWRNRTQSFARLARLLSDRGGGFGAARTSTGCTFTRPAELQRHLSHRTWGRRMFYREGQIDIWFARDLDLFWRASSRITGFLGRGGERDDRYPDDPHNRTCPDQGARYMRPGRYHSAAHAEAERVKLCSHVCGDHPSAFPR